MGLGVFDSELRKDTPGHPRATTSNKHQHQRSLDLRLEHLGPNKRRLVLVLDDIHRD
jgi:hypothetical protein